ncbi:hypothetical protein Bcav_3749 [Beutenbergia cavernae DSM 12333]|uniref:Activator of Hsp90 ATPase 1 family protein n=1 Tax=Beutenbergia cavernae (strain ATCC BAA-8 / DSM 12333 / CCUG 43141 / JCM 11478 / NBRC 16432 / NCIMB 13614 / HKI 0122) TaxID=471853 RepID=C5C3T2_BEUC1|nr:hypothetical protein [Beutenbergia cavernae]ACQ81991.1 hypothetical protein Bcav_3749 [Beutenbergia cavernae DSM 12333]
MTTQKTFKRRVRERMAKTGESYTSARRNLVPDGDDAGADGPGAGPPGSPGGPAGDADGALVLTAEEPLVAATGHGWDHWFAELDAWGGTAHTHTEIARYLTGELDVSGWWAQTITVSYERARGMRAPGEHADGFSVSAAKTVGVGVERLFAAFDDVAVRDRWLPGVPLSRRTASAPRSARYDWGHDGSRVLVGFTAKGPDKATIAVQHERLADAGAAETQKAYWRSAVAALKTYLEKGETDD